MAARYLPSQLRVASRLGIFEGIVCRDIRHWRMIHAALAKGHERVFLRTLLSNFPSICSRQRIVDSIANFFVYRYLALKGALGAG